MFSELYKRLLRFVKRAPVLYSLAAREGVLPIVEAPSVPRRTLRPRPWARTAGRMFSEHNPRIRYICVGLSTSYKRKEPFF